MNGSDTVQLSLASRGTRNRSGLRTYISFLIPVVFFCTGANAQSAISETYCRVDFDLSTLPPDSSLLFFAHAYGQYAPQLQAIWPGFSPSSNSLLIYRGQSAVLFISAGRRLDGLKPLPSDQVPPNMKGPIYLFHGKLGDFLRATGQSAHPQGSAAQEAIEIGARQLSRNLFVIFHEQFHLFQIARFEKLFEDTKQGFRVFTSEEFRQFSQDPEFRRLAGTEKRILALTLETEDHAILEKLLRLYLAVRDRRIGDNGMLEWNEARMERLEGVAEWVGLKGLEASLNCGPEFLKDRLQQRLGHDIWSQGRFYGTGGALVVLLDRLVPDWRSKVEAGAKLHELISIAVDYDSREAADLVNEATARFGVTRSPI